MESVASNGDRPSAVTGLISKNNTMRIQVIWWIVNNKARILASAHRTKLVDRVSFFFIVGFRIGFPNSSGV